VVMTGQFAGDLRPDLVIPFKYDKKAAIAALQNHCKGKPLLPKVFKDENHIKEVKGVYVPVWLYDTDADADMRYKATRLRHWSDSHYNYTETTHFLVTRAGSVGFENVPVDGSTKMADELMESIEPFDVAGGCIAVGFPVLWQFLEDYQRNRIKVLFDPSIDPLGQGIRYHTVQSLKSLTGGGLTGQGLFNGTRTQKGLLYAQHTDYVFSSIGEELGYIGCAVVVLMELAIVARCIYVGIRTPNYMRRLICYGAASSMIFQIVINVGMAIGVMPVIGLTLPLVSYVGSSVISVYAMLGLVSGSYARPDHLCHERYGQPPRATLYD